MNYQRLIEEQVGSVQPDSSYTTYVWFDADTLIYLAALKADKHDIPYDCAEEVLWALYQQFVDDLNREFGFGGLIVNCLSDRRTFRHDVCDTYKANRKDKWKPPLLAHYIATFKEMYDYQLWDNHEADDVVSILNYQIPGHIVCSGDKDLMQCVGLLFNPRTKTVVNITPEAALFHRLYQWLTGDSADGYKGCYLIGDKKATRILQEFFEHDGSVDLDEIVNVIEVLYENQNEKLIFKKMEPHDIQQQFTMSQMLVERWDADAPIPSPLSFLSALTGQGQVSEATLSE